MRERIQDRGAQLATLSCRLGARRRLFAPRLFEGNRGEARNRLQDRILQVTAENRQAADGLAAEAEVGRHHSGGVARRARLLKDRAQSSRDVWNLARTGPGDDARAMVVHRHGGRAKRVRNAVRDAGNDRAAGAILVEEQGATERVEPLEIGLPGDRVNGALAGAGGKLARHDRGEQEREQRDPVLRVGDRQLSDRRENEDVEAERGQQRRDSSFPQAPGRRDAQDGHEVRQRDGGRVDRDKSKVHERNGGDGARRHAQAPKPQAARHPL